MTGIFTYSLRLSIAFRDANARHHQGIVRCNLHSSHFWLGKGPTQEIGSYVIKEFCSITVCIDVGVSKNRGTPKWMVYDGKSY